MLGLLRRRSQTRTALVVASHDAAEEIAGPVANGGRRGLRGAVVLRVLAGATASFEFAVQAGNLILVSRGRQDCFDS